jgi:hypothetical protein
VQNLVAGIWREGGEGEYLLLFRCPYFERIHSNT